MDKILITLDEFFLEDNRKLSDGRVKVSTILTILREVEDITKFPVDKKPSVKSLSEQSVAILCLIGIDLLGKVNNGSSFERNKNGEEYVKFLIDNKFGRDRAEALWELRNSLVHEFSFGNYNSLTFDRGPLVVVLAKGKYVYSVSTLAGLLKRLKNRTYRKFSDMARREDADSNPFLLRTYAFLLEHGFYYKRK